MNVFMIGGTGLLGSEGARELIRRGHSVSAVALPPLPAGADLPPDMHLILGNYLDMSDETLRSCMQGCDAFVFAAGIDERVEAPPPITDLYEKYNIAPIRRLLTLARTCGIRHAVICGSYFAWFDRVQPAWRLADRHPYIAGRVEQARVALSFANPEPAEEDKATVSAHDAPGAEPAMDVAVLELPYIFGAQPGRRPVWLFLIEMIRSMPGMTFYPRGGSAMVTVKQVGQAIAGALERNRGGHRYPIGYENLTWVEMLRVIHRAMGLPNRRIVSIPTWLFRIGLIPRVRHHQKRNLASGLNLIQFAPVMAANLFIDKSLGCDPLGVEADDIEAAITDSVRLCLEILDGRSDGLDMRGE